MCLRFVFLLMDLGEQAHRAKFMIRDHGSNSTAVFDAVLADAGRLTTSSTGLTGRWTALRR